MFRSHHPIFVVSLVLIGLLFMFSSAQAFNLAVRVADTTVGLNATGGWLTIFVANRIDTVAAFTLTLQLDRPDLLQFDSAGVVPGPLISNFALVETNPLTGDWLNVQIHAVADGFPPDRVRIGGFGPSLTERVLFRIPFHMLTVADTMTDRTANIHIATTPDLFSIVRPDGSLIGLIGDPPVLDPSEVQLTDGKLTVSQYCSSRTTVDLDVDRDGGRSISISDVNTLFGYVAYGDTSAFPVNLYAADVDGDCRIDWRDYWLLDSLFNGWLCRPGPCSLPCACDHPPVHHCCYQHRGNVDNDEFNSVDLADLSWLVGYLNGQLYAFCPEPANVDGAGIVDLGDLNYLVSYLTGGGVKTLPGCP